MKIYRDVFEKIISLENLFYAWERFNHDKRKRLDVQQFGWHLEENIFELHRNLKGGIYKHGQYKSFQIWDPKQRLIHKAGVRDRVLHHAIFSVLNPIFEPTFIANSFSCRVGKGTHRGVATLANTLRQVSRNNTHPCFALKCDIEKFFDSIDQPVLIEILGKKIKDEKAMELLAEVINSYERERERAFPHGMPIGNLTSQLFGNICLNELDQFVKNKLKIKHYVRYTDDFIIVAGEREYLENLVGPIGKFLRDELGLRLHPGKVILRKYCQGIDFLGYVILPHHIVLRTKTKKRIWRKLKNGVSSQGLVSYLGVLAHANSFRLAQKMQASFGSR